MKKWGRVHVVILSIITLMLIIPIMQILFTSFLIATMHGYPSPFVIKEVGEGSVRFIGNLINLALLAAPISLATAYGITCGIKRTMEKRPKGFYYVIIIIIVIPIIVIVALIIANIAAGIAACWYCSTYVCPGRVQSCGATWFNVYCNCYQ